MEKSKKTVKYLESPAALHGGRRKCTFCPIFIGSFHFFAGSFRRFIHRVQYCEKILKYEFFIPLV